MLRRSKSPASQAKHTKPIKSTKRSIKTKPTSKLSTKRVTNAPSISISASTSSPSLTMSQSTAHFSSPPTLNTPRHKSLPQSPITSNAFKPTIPQRGLFDPVTRAYNEMSYESPQAQKIKDLPPLGATKYLKQSNDEWEMCYDGAMGQTLIYLKKMSITSLVLSLVSFPFIVTFPSETVSEAGKWLLAGSTVLMGVGSTLFTNVFCSAYVCRAFVNRQHPNIVEFTTAGFTGKYESFRFDVTEDTTDNVERPLTSFKHLATDRHFFVAPSLINHPVWGMILPHLFDVDGEGGEEGKTQPEAQADGRTSQVTTTAEVTTEQSAVKGQAEEQSVASSTVSEAKPTTETTPPPTKESTSPPVAAAEAAAQTSAQAQPKATPPPTPTQDPVPQPPSQSQATPKPAQNTTPPKPELVNNVVDAQVTQATQKAAPNAAKVVPRAPKGDSKATPTPPKH